MNPSFIAWAGKQLKPFRDHIEARQRQHRLARMLRVNPQLRRAQQALERGRRQHRPTRTDIAAMQAAMADQLRRGIHHG